MKWIMEKLADMGYARVNITVKIDGEPAILALVEALAVDQEGRDGSSEEPCARKQEQREY